MCKLLTVSKLKGANKELENLIRLQFAELKTQKDGCAGLTIDFNNKIKVYRELTDYDKVFQAVLKDLPNSKLISIHTRIGTSGGKNLDNVHFFKPKEWYFAHNGFVGKYHKSMYSFGNYGRTSLFEYDDNVEFDEQDMPVSIKSTLNDMVNCQGCYTSKRGYCRTHAPLIAQIKKQEDAKEKMQKENVADKYCDSYQFMQNMPDEINEKKIIAQMSKDNFSGMALMVHENGTDAYMLIAKECYSITDHKTYASFFSYEPELKMNLAGTETLSGVKVKKEKITLSVERKPTEVVKGVYRYNPDKIKIE